MAEPAGVAKGKVRRPGLACPACGHRYLTVIYTRQRPDRIVRLRECDRCTRRVQTHEHVASRVGSNSRTTSSKCLAAVQNCGHSASEIGR